MNEVIHLFNLQTLDHQIDKIDARIAEISLLIETSEALQSAELIAQTVRLQVSESKRQLKRVEEISEKQHLKIAIDEAKLYSGKIHNPKELQDLQQEIASLKKHQTTLDEDQLIAMLLLEEAEKAQMSAETQLSAAQTTDMESKSKLRGELSNLSKLKERLIAERIASQNSIPPGFMEIYLQLRKQKRGTAVSLVTDGSCSSCGSTLRPAEKQAARSPQQITYCSSCGRILYAG
jgi:predicted  nucleic acid-binding Zn-ribbon protein